MSRPFSYGAGASLAMSLAVGLWLMPPGRERSPQFAQPRVQADWKVDPGRADEVRTLALRQARVWSETNPAEVDFASNPPDPTGLLSTSPVRCHFLSKEATGTTPKFDCVLPDGEIVKVKYAPGGELHAEIAASRLLAALGFGADRMYMIPRVRCYGCLRSPYYVVRLLDKLHSRDLLMGRIPDDRYTDFEWAAVERRFDGRAIETADHEGWAWYELDEVDPALEDTQRAERDALKLAAVLIAHWDNKESNQRLVCLDDEAPSDTCPRPFALIHDLGSTFGPRKVNVAEWRQSPVWVDPAACAVSIRHMPFHGGTFADSKISEAGRQLLARQLATLNDGQLVSLFAAARFAEFHGHRGEDGDVHAWARALRDKIRDIVDRGSCP